MGHFVEEENRVKGYWSVAIHELGTIGVNGFPCDSTAPLLVGFPFLETDFTSLDTHQDIWFIRLAGDRF